jgi:predicted PurR-regulated permease PerM
VLFVFLLQQLDGNVIGPKILGDRTGLSSFWVLFAIVLFGGLWGLGGMIVGVPLMAVIYDLVRKYVYYQLEKQERKEEPAAQPQEVPTEATE